MRTNVAIIGAGPAGLMLSHLLHLRGIDSVVLDIQTREAIEGTIKAGVLEQSTVDLMCDAGVGERLLRDGSRHTAIKFAFAGAIHEVDMAELTGGRAVTVYAQHEVLKDLIARRLADGGDLRFGISETTVEDVEDDRPVVSFIENGRRRRLECDIVVGCDGSRTSTRFLIPENSVRTDYFRQYPFAWFGILAEAPPAAEGLVYARSERGFALISTRSPSVQRLYFQCDPATRAADWSDEQIWEELQARVTEAGITIPTGRIMQKDVLQFRSFVCEPMQYKRLFLAGDAAHTVPPTGAKGLNLAMADVYALDRALGSYYDTRDTGLLESYTGTVMGRVWRAQHFSWWMTSMLHRFPEVNGFDQRRQIAELEMAVHSPSASRMLAEHYAGLPLGELTPSLAAA
ncbi:MAG TPA: 4-hydroxybenzoate 3-monooxygenase [Actinomycetaceae bacterium]|nr:4-hydroxybenzoate 3-monooxygenase [Actinomycetaceae bacterium]